MSDTSEIYLRGDDNPLTVLLSCRTVVEMWRDGPGEEILELPFVTFRADEVEGYYHEDIAFLRRDAIALVMPLHPGDRGDLDEARRVHA